MHCATAIPLCVTVKVRPAIVSVALRAAVDVLGAASNVTLPAPLPDAPDVTVSQAALLDALQEQPVGASTVTLPDPPSLENAAPVAPSANVQFTENANGFDGELREIPPGPVAATIATYSTPGVSGRLRRLTNSSRMKPSAPGEGFPRSADASVVVDPTRRT